MTECSCFAHSSAECLCGAWPCEVELARENTQLKQYVEALREALEDMVRYNGVRGLIDDTTGISAHAYAVNNARTLLADLNTRYPEGEE